MELMSYKGDSPLYMLFNETAQMVTSLNGIVSNETLLSLLPFIEKPLEELKRVEENRYDTILFDLDGTLLDDAGKISDYNKRNNKRY